MSKILDWIDHRTGYRHLIKEALYEHIPGGSRWRYVWGSTLTFTFVVQVLTGLVLWMFYSPGAQSAWESVYYLQNRVSGGPLLRGVHHYTAQAMVILLAIHLSQVVIDGAYRAPREFNFWIGLLLMLVVLGFALTGYLLPWDQKGYWATNVATNIASVTPGAGRQVQQLAVGGDNYGNYTLTRFFGIHAGVLPALLVGLVVVHLALFRRHGITVHVSKPPRPDQYFWPEQVLKDAIACFTIIGLVMFLAWKFPPELGAPADSAEAYAAARPEWYFLFLFQFLKLFKGDMGELIGAIVIPGALMFFMFLMPFIGRSRFGHGLCVAVIGCLLAGAVLLTGAALYQDRQAQLFPNKNFSQVTAVLDEIEIDLRRSGEQSKYHNQNEETRLKTYFAGDAVKAAAFQSQLNSYRAYRQSQEYLEAVADAGRQAERAQQLARPGIPPAGALSLLRNDPKTQGPKLFRRQCASCHDHANAKGEGIVTLRPLDISKDGKGRPVSDAKDAPRFTPNGAPNLNGFASRDWLAGFLDSAKIAAADVDLKKAEITGAPYFGNTSHWKGTMTKVVAKRFGNMNDAVRADWNRLIAALSAESERPTQNAVDGEFDNEAIAKLPAKATPADRKKAVIAARTTALTKFECTECHKFHGEDGADAPDLTGYGSRQWLIDFISNPGHTRFYGEDNDRMPSFAADAAHPESNLLTQRDLGLIVDWLRGDWYEPPVEPKPEKPKPAVVK
ncbi:MAG: cytochrome b N-terminal domain-containing protein [Planctomycetia bacterium]|nr:cytochrome b N-terminal domain-containing protein [Planctomycetia bacterium]